MLPGRFFERRKFMSEAMNTSSTYIHVFQKPLECEGNTYNKVTMDFGKLTGKDYMAIDREIREIEGRVVSAAVFDTSFMMRLACRASSEKISFEAIQSAPLADFNRIRDKVRSFLLSTET